MRRGHFHRRGALFSPGEIREGLVKVFETGPWPGVVIVICGLLLACVTPEPVGGDDAKVSHTDSSPVADAKNSDESVADVALVDAQSVVSVDSTSPNADTRANSDARKGAGSDIDADGGSSSPGDTVGDAGEGDGTSSGDLTEGVSDADVSPPVEVDIGSDGVDALCLVAEHCKQQGPCAAGVSVACAPGEAPLCDYSGVALYDGDVELRCDGEDNNCDGQVDEAFGLGTPCDGPDPDGCAGGVRACSEDEVGWVCVDDQSTAEPEVCDGIDNDCDGTIDEGFGTKFEPCDSDGDGCFTGLMVCAPDGTELACEGDEACAQPNPNCLSASKPFDPDVCGCVPGLFCDPVAASGCNGVKCQCGFLGAPCAAGFQCVSGKCKPYP